MNGWTVVEVREDNDAGDFDRWLVLFSVPKDISADGTFSFSLPKDTFNFKAAELGVDVDDEEDVDLLFDHVMQLAHAVFVGESIATQHLGTPEAKRQAWSRVEALRADPAVNLTSNAPDSRTMGAIDGSPLTVIRAGMGLDKRKIASWAAHVEDVKRGSRGQR